MKYRFLLVLTAAIWGFAFVAQVVAMDDIGPFTFSALRSFIGAAALMPLILTAKPAVPTKRAVLPKWLGIGIAGLFFAGGTLFQQCGLVYTTASKGSFITAMYILLVPLFGLFLGQVLRLNHAIGAVLAVAGVYLMAVTEALDIGAGDTLVILCAISFSLHILYCDYASQRYDPLLISAGQFLVCGIISAAGAFLFEEIHPEAILAAWWPVLYVGVFSTGVGYTLQLIGQKYLPPTECSMILSLEMVFGGLSGVLFLGETMSMRELAGVVCMTAGVFLSQLPSRRICGGKRS